MYNAAQHKVAALVVGTVAIMALTASIVYAGGDKVLVCHMTGSESNPVEVIDVSIKAEAAHIAHGDLPYNEVTGLCEEEVSNPS